MKGPQRDRKHRRRSVLDGLGRAATRAGEGTGLPEPFTRTASPPPWSPVGAEGRTSPYFPLAEVPHWAPLQRESRLAANNYIWVRQTLTSLRACHTAKVLAELRARPSPTHTGTPQKRPPLARFVPVYGLGKAEQPTASNPCAGCVFWVVRPIRYTSSWKNRAAKRRFLVAQSRRLGGHCRRVKGSESARAGCRKPSESIFNARPLTACAVAPRPRQAAQRHYSI